MFFRKIKISTKKKHIDQFFFSAPKTYKYYFKKRNFFKNNYVFNKKNFLNRHFFIGFRSVENTYLTQNSMISCMKFFKRFGVDFYGIFGLNYSVNSFPDFWLTSKPKEVRMGKGKGSISKKIFFLKKGSILFQINCFRESHLHFFYMLKKCSLKLPVKNLIIYKFW